MGTIRGGLGGEVSQVEGRYHRCRGAITGGGELELDWSLSYQRWRGAITGRGEQSGLVGSYHR